MRKKALILDLDNTIFPVPSIGNILFAPLFKLIKEAGHHDEEMNKIEDAIMRKPFQQVAESFHFSKDLIKESTSLLKNLVYGKKIATFPDYKIIKKLPIEKYLVTAGFTNMQKSKIKGLGIEKDFKEIHILDHSISGKKKKDVFKEIMKKQDYSKDEILVIGDDPDNELKEAEEMGLPVILYDHDQIQPHRDHYTVISNYSQLQQYLD
jgi:putative hydrolase of the HAD superfamily